MKKLSVIIPTYNEEHYLPKLFDSLVAQTFKDFEVIVSDKSTDKTKEVALKYKDQLDIKVVTLKSGRGVSKQRNYGASFAKTGLLLFLDADDVLFDFALARLLERYSKQLFNYASCWHRPDNKVPIDWGGIYLYNLYAEAINRKAPAISGQFFFVEKAAFDAVGGFNENSSFTEDFELARELHQKGYKLKFFKRPLFKMSDRRIRKEGRLRYYMLSARNGIALALPASQRRRLLKAYELEGYDEKLLKTSKRKS